MLEFVRIREEEFELKIAFIIYYLAYGGIERQMTMLANEMAKRGHQIHLLSFVGNKSGYELDKNVKYGFYPDKGKGIVKIINRYLMMKKALQNISPEVTVNFMPQSAYFCAFMPKSITGKVLYSERGNPASSIYDGIVGIIRKISIPRIDFFVFQINGSRNYYDDNVKKRSVIIPNPVSVCMEDASTIKSRSHRIVNIGRLDSQKNQELLINAFEIVLRKFPDCVLEIYGEGELKPKLEKQIQNMGLRNHVFLEGTYKDIHSRIMDAAVFCLSSDFEGMPNALMEAMALGIPCVSTDCEPGGAKEIICDGVDGIIVPVKDKGSLADGIIALLSDPLKSEEFGREAKKNMKRYDKKKIYDLWENCFNNLIAEAGI